MNKKTKLSEEEKQQRVEELMELLQTGVEKTLNSEHFINYLKTMSKFWKYSFNNSMLIALQFPEATRVASFTTWKSLGGKVKPGSKGIKIFRPCKYKKEVIEQDDTTGEEITKTFQRLYFTIEHVFDISQVDVELPEICKELQGGNNNIDQYIEVAKMIDNVSINYEDISGGASGYYLPKKHTIALKNGMSEAQQVKVLFHEVAHSILHKDFETRDITRNQAELEAEATSFIVCDYLGLDTSNYSFEYVASWLNGTDKVTLMKKALTNIQKASKIIIEHLGLE